MGKNYSAVKDLASYVFSLELLARIRSHFLFYSGYFYKIWELSMNFFKELLCLKRFFLAFFRA